MQEARDAFDPNQCIGLAKTCPKTCACCGQPGFPPPGYCNSSTPAAGRNLFFSSKPPPPPPPHAFVSMTDTIAVDALNVLLAILFPLWPWEIFIVMPFALAYFMSKAIKDPTASPSKSSLILFITFFGAAFCGVGHTAGLIQAFQTILGGKGICVSALPGAPTDIDTTSMCKMMSVHIFLMVTMGYWFIYVSVSPKRRLPEVGMIRAFYRRCALFFVIGGISQIAPYVAVIAEHPSRFGEFMAMTGFYSARWFTPGWVEFVEPIIWICMGLWFSTKAGPASIDKLKRTPPATPVGDDAVSLVSAGSADR